MYVFAGFDGCDRLNDMWRIDLESLECPAWEQVTQVLQHHCLHVSFAHRMGIFRLPAATVHVLWLANTCLCFQDKVELKPPTRQSDRNHTADASNRPCVLGCFRSHLIQTPGQKSLLVIWCSSSSCVVADDHCRSKEGAHRLMHVMVTRLCISTTNSMCLEV